MNSICDVGGVKVGHFTSSERPTGCTVVLVETGATAGVDVRGAAPGTRETDLLNPINTVEKIHAVLLSGGSAFGLDAAAGVMQYLEERGIGYETGAARVPIVPAAILYDLNIGNPKIRPDRQAGYQACCNASREDCPEGSVGAGAGATVGKLFGISRAMKGGTGTASIHIGHLIVGALAAVNAAGDVVDPEKGIILAGARSPDGLHFLDSMAMMRQGLFPRPTLIQNTTIGVVATNAPLTKTQASKVAQMAHDGLARVIRPVHTPYDGDIVFAMATGSDAAINGMGIDDFTLIGSLGAEVLAAAVCRAVRTATSLPGFPGHADFLSSDQRG